MFSVNFQYINVDRSQQNQFEMNNFGENKINVEIFDNFLREIFLCSKIVFHPTAFIEILVKFFGSTLNQIF